MSRKNKSTKPENNNDNRQTKRLFFTGFSMGIADLIPGVSGGTLALLFGIYDELIASIKILTGKFPKLLLKGKFRNALEVIPFSFLFPVGLGIVTAIFSLVYLVTFLLDNYSVFVWSLFFGLIVATALVISKRVKKWDASAVILLLIGFALTYYIVGLSAGNGVVSTQHIFLTGMIASSAMILPGLSGSLIMVIMGQYKNVLEIVSDRDVYFIFTFMLGAITGLALLSRAISWLLKNYYAMTIAFLAGVLFGSLRKVWPWQEEVTETTYMNVPPDINVSFFFALLLAVVGFLLVWQLEKIGIAKEKKFKL